MFKYSSVTMADLEGQEGKPISQDTITQGDTAEAPPPYAPPPASSAPPSVDRSSLKWFPDVCSCSVCGGIVAFFFSIIFCYAMASAVVIGATSFAFAAYYEDAVEDYCIYNNITTYSSCEFTENCGDCDRAPRSCTGTEAMYFYNTSHGTCDNSKLFEIASFSSCYCDVDWMAVTTPPQAPTDTEFTCYINSCGTDSWMGNVGGDWSYVHPDDYMSSGFKALAWCIAFMVVMYGLICVGCRNHPKCILHERLQKCCSSKME